LGNLYEPAKNKDGDTIKLGDVGFKIKKDGVGDEQEWKQGSIYLTQKYLLINSEKEHNSDKEQIEIPFEDIKKICIYVSKRGSKATKLVLELEGFSIFLQSEKKEELITLHYFLIPFFEGSSIREEQDKIEFLEFLKLWSIGARDLDVISYFCGVGLERVKDVKEYALKNGYIDEKRVLKCGDELIRLVCEEERT